MTSMAERASLPWAVALNDPRARRRALTGGKGAGLAALVALGYEVPEALCVTPRAFMEARDAALGAGARTLTALQDALRRAPCPAALATQLSSWLGARADARWAVRSSSVDEDGAQASLAGQQLTCLQVAAEDVWAAVCEVWASVYGVEALVYRDRVGLQGPPPGMAVLIQRQLEPEVAGVLFTRDPLGSADLVVSAARGLGELVVDGLAGVTARLGRGDGALRATSGVEPLALTSKQCARLAAVGRALEVAGDAPQDIEWAFDQEERLWLLQWRPITTQARVDEAPQVWSNANVGEALPGVGTPLTWSIIRRFSRRGFEQAFGSLGLTVAPEDELVGSFQGRVYLNLTQFMRIASGVPLMRASTLHELAGGGGAAVVEQTYTRRRPWAFLASLPVTIPRVASSQLAMPWVAPRWEAQFARHRADFLARDLSRMTQRELSRALTQLDALFDRNGLVMLTCSSNFLMSYVVLREGMRLVMGAEAAAPHERALLTGLQVRSAQPGLALLALATQIKASPALRALMEQTPPAQALAALKARRREDPHAAALLVSLDAFLEAHGHRAPREAELATPRWREDLTFVFDVIQGLLRAPEPSTASQLMRAQLKVRQSAERAVREALPRLARPLGEVFIRFVQQSARRREALRARVVEALELYRMLFLACGERLTQGGLLAAPEEVFALTHEELSAWLRHGRSGADFRHLAITRLGLVAHYQAAPDPPNTFIQRGRELMSEAAFAQRTSAPQHEGLAGGETLRGLPGAAGCVTGSARVVREPSEARSLRAGEILVVAHADVGWTPLFLNAAGVVMALGGPLSHACIVAREYGIPTVVNVHDVMTRVRTGDMITVDGERGLVVLHAPIITVNSSSDLDPQNS